MGKDWERDRVDHRFLISFLYCRGVYSVIKVAVSNIADKELVARSMTILSSLAENRSFHRFLDLTAVTAICIRVLQEYPSTMVCLKPALNVLKTVSSNEAILRLSEYCTVFHVVLQTNLANCDICNQVIRICKPVIEVSPVFRSHSIKCAFLQNMLEAINRHSSHLDMLFCVCEIFTSLSKEPLLEKNALRFVIIDYTLQFASSSIFSSDPAFIGASLHALQAVACMSLGCVQFFVRRQGFLHVATLLSEFGTCLDVVTACCDLILSLCALYPSSRNVLSTGIIQRIVSVLPVNSASFGDFVLCFSSLRAISTLSVDCTKSLLSTRIVSILSNVVSKETNETIIKESVQLLYQLSTVREGCDQLQEFKLSEQLHKLRENVRVEAEIADRIDSILKNLETFSKKRLRSGTNSSYSAPSDPLDFSSVITSPLMGIMDVLVFLDRHTEAEVLASLQQLHELCRTRRVVCLITRRIECGASRGVRNQRQLVRYSEAVSRQSGDCLFGVFHFAVSHS